MKKRFNVTGVCIPGQHYMADTSAKFTRIMGMVEEGLYFTINRPRQYGKTTMLFALTETLQKRADYLAFRISFEGVGDEVFSDETKFCLMFLDLLIMRAEKRSKEAVAKALSDNLQQVHSMNSSKTSATTRRSTNWSRECSLKGKRFPLTHMPTPSTSGWSMASLPTKTSGSGSTTASIGRSSSTI